MEEVALIAYKVTTFCSQLPTHSSQAAREEKPRSGLCTLLPSQVLVSFSKSFVNSTKSSSSDSNTQFYNCLRAQQTHPGAGDAVRPMELCSPQPREDSHLLPTDTPLNTSEIATGDFSCKMPQQSSLLPLPSILQLPANRRKNQSKVNWGTPKWWQGSKAGAVAPVLSRWCQQPPPAMNHIQRNNPCSKPAPSAAAATGMGWDEILEKGPRKCHHPEEQQSRSSLKPF